MFSIKKFIDRKLDDLIWYQYRIRLYRQALARERDANGSAADAWEWADQYAKEQREWYEEQNKLYGSGEP